METENFSQKDVIEFFLDKGIFISPEFFQQRTEKDIQTICDYVKINGIENMTFLGDEIEKILSVMQKNEDEGDVIDVFKNKIDPVVLGVFNKNDEQASRIIESEESVLDQAINQIINQGSKATTNGSVQVMFTYEEEVLKKREIQDFVVYFNNRYKAIRNILMQRQEMQDLTSINRVKTRKESGPVTICGLILAISKTKNDNIIITLEDPTDTIKILFTKTKPEIYELAKTLVEDEVIGVVGTVKENFMYSSNLIFPDIPATKELKRAKDEAYAIFISDIHVGSKLFMEEEFRKLMSWLSGEVGSDEQKRVASLVKYVFVTGDLIDGVGIYPKMENDLNIKDIEGQYNLAAELLMLIPKDKSIIICPGNHDAMRIAEPQLKIPQRYAPKLYDMPNVTMVSNPAIIKIHKSDDFEGFDVLMYHGYSYDYYYINVDNIRLSGGMDKPDLIMKFLLKRRHLAPTYKSTQIIPDTKADNLVISKVPDFFVSGHVHRTGIVNYRGVSLISSSCFQLKTDFQEKVGHRPEPGRVPLVNLKTREIKMLRFF